MSRWRKWTSSLWRARSELLQTLLLLVGTTIAFQQCRLMESQAQLADLQLLDHIQTAIAEREQATGVFASKANQLQGRLHGDPSESVLVAWDAMGLMGDTVFDEDVLLAKIGPFVPSELRQEVLDGLESAIENLKAEAKLLLVEGYAPIVGDHFKALESGARHRIGSSVILERNELRKFRATDAQMENLRERLAAYEAAAQRKILALVTLRNSIVVAVPSPFQMRNLPRPVRE